MRERAVKGRQVMGMLERIMMQFVDGHKERWKKTLFLCSITYFRDVECSLAVMKRLGGNKLYKVYVV